MAIVYETNKYISKIISNGTCLQTKHKIKYYRNRLIGNKKLPAIYSLVLGIY